ncbi:FMN-dependent NADH-azoreductase 1 [compost metagenome]
MSTTLIINAHPQYDSKSSFSMQVLDHFWKMYKESNPNETIEQVTLYRDYIPALDSTVLGAWEKLSKDEPLSLNEEKITTRMSEVVRQFKRAKKYIIAMPLHNFNVPSKLKDYMDNVLIARETFKYTEDGSGSVGLLKDGRSVLVIQGSGGFYTNDDWYAEVEYSNKYLKSMFYCMGIEDYNIIRAQGTAVLNPEELLKTAYLEVEEAVSYLSKV